MFGIFKGKKKDKGKPPTREQLHAQAMENARQARERLGEENIRKMAYILQEQQKSDGTRARDQIRAMDKAHIADHVKIMLEEK